MAIIGLASAKGGQGKTRIAVEIAAQLDAVILDLDYQRRGGATGLLGAEPREWLIAALERSPGGGPPRVRPGGRLNQPDLVPTPAELLAGSRVEPVLLTECLTAWHEEWGRDLVVDTHGGLGELTSAALDACHLVMVPVQLELSSLGALEEALDALADYPLLVVPNRVGSRPNARMVARLRQIVGRVPVAPVISDHPWMPRRLRRAAISLTPNPGVKVRRAQEQFRAVSEEATRWLLTASPS